MATFKELTNAENKFRFRGKIYKFRSFCPIPSIEMITDDGEIFSFGRDTSISEEFELIANKLVFSSG